MQTSFALSSSFAPVAQWIEHQLPELGVVGSTPIGRTIIIKGNHMSKKVRIAKLNRNNNHKHSEKRKHIKK